MFKVNNNERMSLAVQWMRYVSEHDSKVQEMREYLVWVTTGEGYEPLESLMMISDPRENAVERAQMADAIVANIEMEMAIGKAIASSKGVKK